MAVFRINLIRSQTPSPAARRRLYWIMLLYLAVCGIVLVAIVSRGTKRLVATAKSRAQIARIEEQFGANHPGQQDLLAYGRRVKQELVELSDTLDAVQAVCQSRVRVAQVLRALARPLPQGVDILRYEADEEKQTMEFEIALPIEGSAQAVDAVRLVALWNEDAELRSQVGRISLVRSQRQRKESRLLDVWQFACTLRPEGNR